MKTHSPTDDLQIVREYVEKECGLRLDGESRHLVETGLTNLMLECDCQDYAAFYELIRGNTLVSLRDRIVDTLTSKETAWFRDGHPFSILKDKTLAACADDILLKKRYRVRIWSAGCSTGEEAYSIAMVVDEFCRSQNGIQPEQFEILGTDISPASLLLAMAGRYSPVALERELPEEMREPYFRHDGRAWEVDSQIRAMVQFKKFNLQECPSSLGKFDVVFMRYVADAFSDDLRRQVYASITRSLSPSGHLILGEGECPEGSTDAYEKRSHAGGDYYVYVATKGAQRGQMADSPPRSGGAEHGRRPAAGDTETPAAQPNPLDRKTRQ